MNLKDIFTWYNETASPMGQLVPWFEQITPGLIINQDGSLLAAFEYEGIDYDSTNDDDHDVATQSLETAFRAFDDRNVMWSYLDKRTRIFVDKSNIPHPVANYVEQEWINYVDDGNLATFRHVMFIGFRPFQGTGSFFDEIGAMMSDKGLGLHEAIGHVLRSSLMMKSGIERLDGKIESNLRQFENQLDSFVQVLPRLNFKRLEGESLLSELSNRINLATPRKSISTPNIGPVYLNTLLPTDTMLRVDGGTLKFVGAQNEKFVGMLSVKGYPGIIQNKFAEQMLMVRGDFSVVQMFRFLNREKAKSLVMDAEQHYRSQVKSPLVQMVEKATGQVSEKVDTGQLVLAEDAQAALVEITAEGVNFGYHTMAVQVLGDTEKELESTRKIIGGILSNAGYGVVKEVVHQVGAFMASIPGATDASVRSTLVSTKNLADMAVVRSIQPGDYTNKHLTEHRQVHSPFLCLFPTPSGVPEMLNLHVGDVGHFMVVGPNGAGKTSLINLLIMCWQRYMPCRVIVLDKDKSCYLTIKALGGTYLTLENKDEGTSHMNPLKYLGTPARWGDITRWILGAMDAFGGAEITATQAQTISNAITMMAANFKGEATLSQLKAMLDGMDKDLSARLAPWVRASHGISANYGHLFDNSNDGFGAQMSEKSGVIGVDLGGLLRDERLAPSVLEYLFMSIDDLVDGKTPTLIYLEEAWYLLGNPRFRSGFEDWIKTMRKRLGVVGLSTQSVEDIRRSGISSTLNDNIKTRFYLPNSQAFASRDVYTEMLGLTEDHVQLIRELTPKRHYMAWQDGRTRILDGHLNPNVLALTRADRLARDTFDKWHATGQPNYIDRYVKEITNA